MEKYKVENGRIFRTVSSFWYGEPQEESEEVSKEKIEERILELKEIISQTKTREELKELTGIIRKLKSKLKEIISQTKTREELKELTGIIRKLKSKKLCPKE